MQCSEAVRWALRSAEAELCKHFTSKLGYCLRLVNRVDSQCSNAWACTLGFGKMKHMLLRVACAKHGGEKTDHSFSE